MAHAQPMPEPRVIQLNDRVHVLMGPIQHANPANQGFMINSTLIVGERGAILVDTGGSVEVGRHLARAVRRITAKPVTHVINTHHHGDHYLGNAAFAGARIVSSEECRRLVLETGGEWLAIMRHDIGHGLGDTEPVAAQSVHPAGRNEARIEGVRMVFWVPRGSHTAGDLMVHLPDDRILVAGDVLVNGVVPTLQDGSIANWIATLGDVAALEGARFVPGHGEPMTTGDVTALRAALSRFREDVRSAYRRGIPLERARSVVDVSAWEKLERPHVIGRNIQRVYLEVERESFDE